MVKYTHLKLNEDVTAPAGYYTPEKESRLQINGREILHILSRAVMDASCCDDTDFPAALVPGYIIEPYIATNADGLSVSEVEPVTDRATRDKIGRMIRETENIFQVEFW